MWPIPQLFHNKGLLSLGMEKQSPRGSAAESVSAKTHSQNAWVEDFEAGLSAYCLTTLPVLLGVLFGVEFLRPANGDDTVPTSDMIAACFHYDAIMYLKISQRGYSYDPEKASLVAFFPAYPILSRWVGETTNMPTADAALVVSNTALLGAFVLLARYVRNSWPEANASQRGIVLAIFGLWPMGLFFRMPYAESLFLCGTICILYGMNQNWPLIVLAMLSGSMTAVRPVGVALTAAFLWHLLNRSALYPRAKFGRFLLLAPVACWGLIAYMWYQWMTFGTPWAFAQTQEHWNIRVSADRTFSAKLWSLATLEPIWGMYMPGHQCYLEHTGDGSEPIFSLMLWNPILFLLSGVILVHGSWMRWLNGSELILGTCLMVIPYITRSYEMSMASHGRFAAVVVVNYLVLGRIMARASTLSVVAICAICAIWIFIFTSLYVTSHAVF